MLVCASVSGKTEIKINTVKKTKMLWHRKDSLLYFNVNFHESTLLSEEVDLPMKLTKVEKEP